MVKVWITTITMMRLVMIRMMIVWMATTNPVSPVLDGELMKIMDTLEIIMTMGHTMTKLKMKKSKYQKALESMEKETNRAVMQVEKLSKLYVATVKKNTGS
jgi:hypothetical protein